MKKAHIASTLLIAAIALTLTVAAARAAAAQEFPRPSAYVNDFAGVLDETTINELNRILGAVENRTGAQITVAIVQSIEPLAIEDYAVKLFESWGIGKKGKDNGVLILVAMKERRIKIEVGYGLEGAVPDGVAGSIIDNDISPRFKQGDFSGGVRAGVQQVASYVLKEYNLTLDDVAAGYQQSEPVGKQPNIFQKIAGLIFLIFMIILFIKHPTLFLLLLFSGGRGGGWSSGRSGGFGGGFGGFGGGMSGGGGASGGW